MTHDYTQDVISIREWMSKESYLPQDFEDELLVKFLHSCYGSLERTKKCLDKFCSCRSQMPEVYTRRDPLSSNLQTTFSTIHSAHYIFEKNQILVFKYNAPNLEKFIFYDIMKAASIVVDWWIKYDMFIADGHYIIFDMTYYSLKMIPKINIIYFRDFVLYLLEGFPVRLKKILVVNAPSFYDVLYATVKPILPQEITSLIHVFPDYQGLYQFIDKKYLPLEYGGEAISIEEHMKKWIDDVDTYRNFFLNDNQWKADLKKKPKNSEGDAMNGSFRSICID